MNATMARTLKNMGLSYVGVVVGVAMALVSIPRDGEWSRVRVVVTGTAFAVVLVAMWFMVRGAGRVGYLALVDAGTKQWGEHTLVCAACAAPAWVRPETQFDRDLPREALVWRSCYCRNMPLVSRGVPGNGQGRK